MNKQKFDERQLWIRGNIFKHMFSVIAALVIVNSLLMKFDIIWADGYYSNMIIFFAAVATGSLEMIFREVYFTNTSQRWILIMFGFGGLSLLIINIIYLLKGENFISNGSLSETGGSFIYSVLIFSIGFGGAIKLLYDKLHKKE